MIRDAKEVVEEVLIAGFLEDSVHEFEVCCRRAIEGVLAVPTMNAGRFGISPDLENPYRTACMIRSENEEYSVIIVFGFDPAELAALVTADSELDMQLDAVAEITNVLSGRFVTPHRFSERFGAVSPSLPFFANGGSDAGGGHAVGNPAGRNPAEKSPSRDSWCIQGQLRVNSVRVFLGVAIGKTAREGSFSCKNPL